MPNSLWPHGIKTARLLCPWDFPGRNTGVGCHFLLQGTFLTQGSICRQVLPWLSLWRWCGVQQACSPYCVIVFWKSSWRGSWVTAEPSLCGQVWILEAGVAGVEYLDLRSKWSLTQSCECCIQFSSVAQSCPTLCNPMDCCESRECCIQPCCFISCLILGKLLDPPWSLIQFGSVTQSCPTLRLHGLQPARLPCSSPTPKSLLRLMSLESVMPPNHLILCHAFSSCPQSFPASGSLITHL